MHGPVPHEQEKGNGSLIPLQGGHYLVARRIKNGISLRTGIPVFARIREHVENNSRVINLASRRTVRSILLLDGGYLLLTSEHADALLHSTT